MKKLKSLSEYVDDSVINKAEKEKNKYGKYIKNTKKDNNIQSKPKEKIKKRMEIKNYIIFLLGRREYSEKEIRTKLKLREHTEIEIDEALVWAKENNYQSDERYTKSHLKYRSLKRGNNKLLYEMKSKGIDEDIIKEAIEELDSEDDRLILALDKYKNREMNDKLKEKAFRSLALKGFSYGNIKKAWNEVFNNENN